MFKMWKAREEIRALFPPSQKPRIKRFAVRPGGLIELLVLPPNWKDIRYECRGAGRVGYGDAPMSAYREWVRVGKGWA